MPAYEDEAAGCGASDDQTNNAAYPEASAVASIKPEDGPDSARMCVSYAREESLRYPPVPHPRFESFSGHEPHTLHHNITETARNALPPPFQNGFYLPRTNIPPNLTAVESPGLRSRQPSHAETIGESACSVGAGPRYEPHSEENLDRLRNGPWPCGQDDPRIVQDRADESHDIQWEAAERTCASAAGVRPETSAGSGHPLREAPRLSDYSIFANNLQPTWDPDRQAQTTATRESPSISNEEPEPKSKRRKTTNTEAPSHPPADAIYQPGTDPIPPEILSIVAQIKSLPRKQGDRGYPMPTKLRAVPGMNLRIGFISKSSPLMSWYGDTRLLTAKWWMWLYVGGKARKELERELGESDEVDRRSEDFGEEVSVQ